MSQKSPAPKFKDVLRALIYVLLLIGLPLLALKLFDLILCWMVSA